MKNLVLVGFMGSGKTSAGKRSARQLGLTFLDMDDVIEQRAGQTISQIFQTRGEPAFREMERALVRELAGQSGLVVATGGGVVLQPDNIADFSRTGVVVCCWVDARVAYDRTKNAKHRPLLETDSDRLARVTALLEKRAPLYRAIPLRVDTSAISEQVQADELVRLYRQHASD